MMVTEHRTIWGCTACGHTFPNPPVFARGPACPVCGGRCLVSPPPIKDPLEEIYEASPDA